jgi:DNA-binding CsgD family transcriptional regulator
VTDAATDAQLIAESDLRALIRLLGEVAEVGGDHLAKRRSLMDGLAELIDAEAWACGIVGVDRAARKPAAIHYASQGLSDRHQAAMLESYGNTTVPLTHNRPMTALVAGGEHCTRTGDQLADDKTGHNIPPVCCTHLDHGFEQAMCSIYPLDGSMTMSIVQFFRCVGRVRFDARDRRIAHIVTSEVEWLHRADLPTGRGGGVVELTPRLRTVLALLVDGNTRDDIAARLSLSSHTVKDYVKQIYRHFGVKSQVKLIRRFRVGNGGDVA